MTLACPHLESAPPGALQVALMAFSIVAPLAVFLLLPKRLPLREELRFAMARLLAPLARLATRTGAVATDEDYAARLSRAARATAEKVHGAGALSEVVRDDRLWCRAHALGRGVALFPLIGFGVLASLLVSHQSDGPEVSLKFVAAGLPAVLVAMFLCRVGGESAGLWAQAIGLGCRSLLARLGGGALVGLGYGAFTGFSAGVASMLLFLPTMSLLTGDPPRLDELYLVFGLYGAVAAALGALLGVLLCTPLALRARSR